MNYSAAELKAAARRALDEGNRPMALELGRRAMQQEEREASNKEWVDGMMSTDEGFVENARIAVGRGFSNVKDGAVDLYNRATGNDEAVAEMDQRRSVDDAGWGRFKGENPVTATVGEFVGEAAATLPLGMGAAGAVGKATGMGTASLTARQSALLAASEGAVADSIATRGDAEERLKAGLISGATGGIADAWMTKAGRALARRSARKSYLKEGIADEERYIQRTIDQVEADGGYRLDAADASGRETVLDARDRARALDSNEMRKFEAVQERDIAEQARDFADGTQGINRAPEEIADDLKDILADERSADFSSVDAAYNEWRGSFGSQVELPMNGFMNEVDNLMGQVNEGQRGIVMRMNSIMKRHGISEGEPLSVDVVEKVIQDVNSLYKPNDSKYNRAAGKVKEALDQWVDDALESIGDLPADHPVALGRQARATARKMHEKWNTGDIVDKLTKANSKTAPLDALHALNAKKNHGELAKLKMRLKSSKDPRAAQVWADMEAMPIFDAISAALPAHASANMAEGGVDIFNSKAFANSINRLSESTQRTLWGDEGAKAINDAVVAWSQRGRKIQTRGNPNTSGTARAIGQSGIRAAGGKMLMALPWIDKVAVKVQNRAIRKGGEAIRAGKLDKRSIKAVEQELREEFAETYKNAPTKYGVVFDYLAREMAREMTDSDE